MPPSFFLLVPGGRRRRPAYITLIVVLSLAVAALIYHDSLYLSDLSSHLHKDLAISAPYDNYINIITDTDPSEDDDNRICEPDECMEGSWTPRESPFRTLSDFKREYPPTHRGIFKLCGSEETKREPEDRDAFHKAQEERMIQAMNWIWKPTKGRMRDWDAVEFAVRLLRSPGGLIFSGDSITRQHFQWLEYALARADIYITEDPSHLPSYSHNLLHQFILRPGDSMTTYLQSRAGVPDSRLQRPIYTKIDNHILVGEKEVRQWTVPLGAKQNFPWYDIFEYFEGWEDFVREAAKDRLEENVTEDTILVLNTGAHWSRGAWYMLPNTGDASEQQQRVTTAFRNMIDLIVSQLDIIPKLSIYYRSTAPGHPACSSSAFYQTFRVNSTITLPSNTQDNLKLFTNSTSFFTHPFEGASTAQLAMSNIGASLELSTTDTQQSVIRSRWDWDRLEAHNAEWKHVITELSQLTPKEDDNTSPDSSVKAKWYFMDIWSMALQRPDAHTQNLVDPSHDNYDCLHWCVPGVVEQWMQYLSHLVFFNGNTSHQDLP